MIEEARAKGAAEIIKAIPRLSVFVGPESKWKIDGDTPTIRIFLMFLRLIISARPVFVLSLIALSIVSSACEVANAWLLPAIIDKLSTSPDISQISREIFVWAILYGISLMAHRLIHSALFQMSSVYSSWLQDLWFFAALQHTVKLPLSFHAKNDSGALIAKLKRCSWSAQSLAYTLLGADLLISIPSFFSTFILVLTTSPELWWAFILPIPFYIGSTYYFEKQYRNVADFYYSLYEVVDQTSADVMRNLASVKLYGREQPEIDHIAHGQELIRRQDTKAILTYFKRRSSEELVESSSKIFLLLVCLSYVLSGSLRVGQITFLLSLQNIMFWPVSRVNSLFVSISKTITDLRPLLSVFAEKDTLADSIDAIDCAAPKIVSARNLGFSYEEGKPAVFSGLNLEISKGTTAIVGPSGAGKSTLSSLLTRGYDPTEGAILWDGVDLRKATAKSRQRHVSVVPQDAQLFNRTVKENIAFGCEAGEISDEEIIQAAKTANAHDFIEKLADGYNTVIGERGVLLSGGQKQRLAIARAIARKPALLIMDESTSNLDAESENAIKLALERIQVPMKVVIAHRLATVVNADKIVVLDGGKVTAVGRHHDLLESSELYKRLCELQFTAPESPPRN